MILNDNTCQMANAVANEAYVEQYVWDAMKAVVPTVTQLCLSVTPSMIPGGPPNININPEMAAQLSYIIAKAMWKRICGGGEVPELKQDTPAKPNTQTGFGAN